MPVVFGLLLALGAFFRTVRRAWAKPEFRGIATITLITIAFGTWFFYRYEPTITNGVDALYFTVITLTTVGYGDFSPTTTGTKLFAIFYIFVGLGIIGGFISVVGGVMLEDSAERSRQRTQDDEP